MTFTHGLSTNNYGPAKLIVATSAANGTHTTLASAMAAAVSGDTIFMRNSVSEDVTLTPGVNITSLSGNGDTPQVTITGKLTMTGAGTCVISNVRLQTNSDFCVVVSGSAASILMLENCYINAPNNTGLSHTSSSSSSIVACTNCTLSVASGAFFSKSSAGVLGFNKCSFGQSTNTDSTNSAGTVSFEYCSGSITLTTSGSSNYFATECQFQSGSGTPGATVLTHGGTGADSYVRNSSYHNNSNTNPAISISAGATLKTSYLNATNFFGAAPNISGAGALQYSAVSSLVTTNTTTPSTLTALPLLTGPLTSTSINFGNNSFSNYLIGTFTPTFVGASVAGTTTYTAQNGYYIRIGNVVQVQGYITASGATGTGTLTLGSLPFTIKSQTNGNVAGSVFLFSSNTWPVASTSISIAGANNTTTASLYCCGTATTGGNMQMANVAWSIVYNIIYEI